MLVGDTSNTWWLGRSCLLIYLFNFFTPATVSGGGCLPEPVGVRGAAPSPRLRSGTTSPGAVAATQGARDPQGGRFPPRFPPTPGSLCHGEHPGCAAGRRVRADPGREPRPQKCPRAPCLAGAAAAGVLR